MAKKKGSQQKTDKIHLKLVHIEIMKTIYKLSFRVIVDGTDGKAKAGAPFSVLYGKEEIHGGMSDANGMASFGYRLKYSPTLESIDLICKITGSTAKCFETFQLPTPGEVKITSNSVKQNNEGGFTASFTVNVTDKQKKPRPNCKVVFKGNGQEQSSYTDTNGVFVFTTDIEAKSNLDEMSFTAQCGHLIATEKISVPEYKVKTASPQIVRSADNWLKRFPNWKYNSSEILGKAVKTFATFAVVILLCIYAGVIGNLAGIFIINAFLFNLLKANDIDESTNWGFLVTMFIFSLFLFNSIIFVSSLCILALVFHFWEELSRGVDIDTKKGTSSELNPYPRYPVTIAILLCAYTSISWLLYLVGQTPFMWPYGTENGHLSQGLISAHEIKMYTEATGMEIQRYGMDNPKHYIVNIRSWLLRQMYNPFNWFYYSIIQSIYASPGEITNFLQRSQGAAGKAGGFATIFVVIQQVWDAFLSGFILRRGRKK